MTTLLAHPSPGTTSSTVCPFCNGGRTHEISFNVTNTGTEILYICHRASCGKSGRYFVDGDVPEDLFPKPRWKPQVRTPSKVELQQLINKYHLTPDELSRLRPQMCVDTKQKRWWYPVFGPHGSTHGGVARSLEPGVRPKVLTYLDDTSYHLGSWYLHTSGVERIALVEDQVSAARLSGYVTTVALMGTHLHHDLLMFLARHRVQHLFIVLDSDAFDKAVKMSQGISPYFPKTTVVPLDVDIKNDTRAPTWLIK